MTDTRIIFRFLVGMLIGLSLMLLDTMGWSKWFRGGVETVMKPELWMLSGISRGASGIIESVRFASSGPATVAELKKELAVAQQKAMESEHAREENESLKKVLGSTTLSTRFRLTPARVLSIGSSLVIEQAGFSPGQVVVTSEGSFVGSIERTGAWSARVRLPTDVNSRLGVSIMLPDGKTTSGELHGVFGASMTVSKILGDIPLSPGQLVVTAGAQENMPPGILIGTIGSSINHQDAAVYQSAVVDPAIDFSSLTTVMVIQ